MSSRRKPGVATILLACAVGLSLVTPHMASSEHLEDSRKKPVDMTWTVKKINVSQFEGAQQDILKGVGKPFGRVTITMNTPQEDLGLEEKTVDFSFDWKGHPKYRLQGYIPIKNTVLKQTKTWVRERVQLDGVGEFRQFDQGEIPVYDGKIKKFSGVLKCYFANRTCTGEIGVRGWFLAYGND
jgi:hypothetical protein